MSKEELLKQILDILKREKNDVKIDELTRRDLLDLIELFKGEEDYEERYNELEEEKNELEEEVERLEDEIRDLELEIRKLKNNKDS
jgi:peptidoglycan hydrolase CwlO-like protein